jgi:hypothetical protein
VRRSLEGSWAEDWAILPKLLLLIFLFDFLAHLTIQLCVKKIQFLKAILSSSSSSSSPTARSPSLTPTRRLEMFKIISFPPELLLIIKEFLAAKEWCSFINITKSFDTLKKRSLIIELKHSYCNSFYSTDAFREKLLTQVMDPKSQISVFCEYAPSTVDIYKFTQLYSLVLNSYQGIKLAISE